MLCQGFIEHYSIVLPSILKRNVFYLPISIELRKLIDRKKLLQAENFILFKTLHICKPHNYDL